ncbi:MAG: S53 family peptidase [Steroidobacteraceae bacterium]|jgi:subtilase family serine protease
MIFASNSRALGARVAALAMMFCTLVGGYASARPNVVVKGLLSKDVAGPPGYNYCTHNFGEPCYSPQQIRTAYGLNGLIDAGMVGAGQTIILIESYGSPTIAADLEAFDAGYGLPNPPSLTVLAPLGTVPWDPGTYPAQPGWGYETTLDVEWAHAMAPGAAIVVLTSPVAETEGVQGLPEFLKLEKYALDNHLGNIISQSWAATENTLFDAAGRELIADYSVFYARAVTEHVTVLAAAGDTGSSSYSNAAGTKYYPFPTVNFPASSPLVTGVGGTALNLEPSGKYLFETVWNDAGCCAGGGGISQVFTEPGYQQSSLPEPVQKQLGGMRGVPDVSYNAAVDNDFIWVYVSFPGSGGPGWAGIGGTSEGSPQWAGIIADLNQYAGKPLGFLNPALYALAGAGLFSSFGRDITAGDNQLRFVPGAVAPGYAATHGWDPASGWGTPNLVELPDHALELLDY